MNDVGNNGVCATDNEKGERLKQFAWIALLIALLSAFVLGGLIYFLSGDTGSSYTDMIKAQQLSRAQLLPALWVAGLFLFSLVALITGFIALYSSFRVAGPLYRFARNLSLSEKHSIVGIREGDCLQDVSRQLQDSIHSLAVQKQAIRELLERAEAAADEGAVADYTALVKQLKARLAGVHTDD